MHLSLIALGRFTILPLITLSALVFTVKVYQHRRHPMLMQFLGGAIGMLIAALSALPNPIIWWLHLLGTISMHYSVLCFYVGIDHLLHATPERPIVTRPVFLLTTACTSATTLLDVTRRTNLNPIIDNNPYTPTWHYFTSEFIHYFIVAYLTSRIVLAYYRDIRIHKTSLVYTIRRYITNGASASRGQIRQSKDE